MSKLVLEISAGPLAGDFVIEATLSGAQHRNGSYTAKYDYVKDQCTMTGGDDRFPLNMTTPASDLTDATSSVVDYFERHGCLN
jgi:hypothetical protein